VSCKKVASLVITRGPSFPTVIHSAQPIRCDGLLHFLNFIIVYNLQYSVIDCWNGEIFRLSDNKSKCIEVGEIGETRNGFAVASLNRKIYIIEGQKK